MNKIHLQLQPVRLSLPFLVFFLAMLLAEPWIFTCRLVYAQNPVPPTDEVFCRSCHSANLPDRHHNYGTKNSLACLTCHTEQKVNGLIEYVTERNCAATSCHGNYFPSHAYGDNHIRTKYDPTTDLAQDYPGTPCATCHNDSSGSLANWVDIRFEHDVETNGNTSCDTCHRSGRSDVMLAIQNGLNGTTQNCLDCHSDKQPPATHGYVPHEQVGFVTRFSGCITTGCHDGNEVVLDIHKAKCSHCHTTVPGLKQGLSSGDCLNCHTDRKTVLGNTIMYGGAHHTNSSNSMTGDCMWCHTDPRLEFDQSPPAGQLACLKCHGSFMHEKGGPIQDFSVCFDCHQPQPYHPKPATWPGWYGEITAAPGRGSFNLFYDELQPLCAPDCEHSLENRPGYGEDSPPEQDQGRNWRTPTIDYSMITFFDYFNTNTFWTVPTFGDSSGGQPPPQTDTVNITTATYSSSSDRLTVYAQNTLGNNAQLSVNYDGKLYPMKWNTDRNRWEALISSTRCNDSTIEVFSSSGGSAVSSVQNCSSYSPVVTDTVNITSASYSRSSDRLTVYAQNTLGNNAQLSVSYDGRSYAMTWNREKNRWEISISSSRCNDSTIEVVSSAGGKDTSSVENCSSYSSYSH